MTPCTGDQSIIVGQYGKSRTNTHGQLAQGQVAWTICILNWGREASFQPIINLEVLVRVRGSLLCCFIQTRETNSSKLYLLSLFGVGLVDLFLSWQFNILCSFAILVSSVLSRPYANALQQSTISFPVRYHGNGHQVHRYFRLQSGSSFNGVLYFLAYSSKHSLYGRYVIDQGCPNTEHRQGYPRVCLLTCTVLVNTLFEIPFQTCPFNYR